MVLGYWTGTSELPWMSVELGSTNPGGMVDLLLIIFSTFHTFRYCRNKCNYLVTLVLVIFIRLKYSMSQYSLWVGCIHMTDCGESFLSITSFKIKLALIPRDFIDRPPTVFLARV